MTKVVIYCRGTNPDKLVQHPFTHRNYVFGETFENGGYVVLEASKVVPKVVILVSQRWSFWSFLLLLRPPRGGSHETPG